MAPNLQRLGGALVQAEDELASINMIIGASYGGTPALTATSGPGLALMAESLGLAVAAEVPLVVVDVMRGGPSTGIPTKSEQSDLNIALFGLHGDAPHLVLAPTSVGDCVFTTQWAVSLAEALQSPAIVLSDQMLGQTRAIIDRPADIAFVSQRATAGAAAGEFRRYTLAGTGVSPMATPGTPGSQYTADGLEHDERGLPSSRSDDHVSQLDKRAAKLDDFDYGNHWAEIEGEGSRAVIAWGSSTGAVREALARLRRRGRGRDFRLISPRLLAPARPARWAEALEGVERALVVELNHSAQFRRYLKGHCDPPCPVDGYHRPGPLPLRAGELVAEIEKWSRS
jgi:2-oxoglutarate ferredoxin oxidoreductase subunit alpha